MPSESTWGYLGPSGTFTESALRAAHPEGTATPYKDVNNALEALINKAVDFVVLPIENSVEGGVTAAFDSVAGEQPFRIVKEVVLPISFVLAVQPGVSIESVTTVASHPHAQAQCRSWLTEHMPEAEFLPTGSTASAAASLARGSKDHKHIAALCAPAAAAQYGLDIAMAGIADNRGAVTRFVVVGRPAAPPAPTGADKTSLVVFQTEDIPGGLQTILTEFSNRGVNLVRIESRPTGEALGKFCFAIDVQGHVAEPRVAHALMALHRTGRTVLFLGSYPSSDTAPVYVPRGERSEDYTCAEEWLATVTGQIAEPARTIDEQKM